MCAEFNVKSSNQSGGSANVMSYEFTGILPVNNNALCVLGTWELGTTDEEHFK